jgi:hypothetical protein
LSAKIDYVDATDRQKHSSLPSCGLNYCLH